VWCEGALKLSYLALQVNDFGAPGCLLATAVRVACEREVRQYLTPENNSIDERL
jgi:hypothetical protein